MRMADPFGGTRRVQVVKGEWDEKVERASTKVLKVREDCKVKRVESFFYSRLTRCSEGSTKVRKRCCNCYVRANAD